MPTKKKKSTVKKSHTAKPKTGDLKSFKLKPWHVLTGIALFVVGGFVVAFSKAATNTPNVTQVDSVISYEDSNGPLVVKLDSAGAQQYSQAPATIDVTTAGDVYCYDANADQGTNRRLTSQQVTDLLNALKASNITQPPINDTNTVVVQAKNLRFQDTTTGQSSQYSVVGNTPEPAAFTQAVGLLKAACQQPSNKLRRIQKPVIKSNNPTKNATPTTSFNILRSITQTAHAAVTPWSQQFDVYLIRNINNTRAGAGLPGMTLQSCLQSSSWRQSVAMSNYYDATGWPTWFHTADLFGAIANRDVNGSVIGCIGETSAGEIVGYNTAAPSPEAAANNIFNNYMNSPGHRAIIMSGSWNRYNCGSSLSTNQAFVFNTCQFMATADGYSAKK